MKLLRSYFFWTYERGSFHYNVMVTLILLFLFVSPRFVDFKDRPVAAVPLGHREVLVKEQGRTGRTGTGTRFIYEIRVDDLHGATSNVDIREKMLGVIEPIAGSVKLEKYTPVLDARGRIFAYDATVSR